MRGIAFPDNLLGLAGQQEQPAAAALEEFQVFLRPPLARQLFEIGSLHAGFIGPCRPRQLFQFLALAETEP